MKREDDLIIKRSIELSRISYERDIYTFTNFYNLNEISILKNIDNKQLYTKYQIFGGYKLAQRQMINFIPDAVSYNSEYPIVFLKIIAKNIKFTEKLTHRDYLGSILGLGIDRCKIGDILIENKYAIVIVHEKIAEFIIQHLTKVKNTLVTVDTHEILPEYYEPNHELLQGTVSSLRLDTVISLAYKDSRSTLVKLIEAGKVFVNGKLITNNGYKIKKEDYISVRGIGKLQYVCTLGETKKNKLLIQVKKFI